MKYKLIFFITILFYQNVYANEAYFDLSEKQIEIETDFNGKEIIIFGTLQVNEDTVIIIEGPKKDTQMMNEQITVLHR